MLRYSNIKHRYILDKQLFITFKVTWSNWSHLFQGHFLNSKDYIDCIVPVKLTFMTHAVFDDSTLISYLPTQETYKTHTHTHNYLVLSKKEEVIYRRNVFLYVFCRYFYKKIINEINKTMCYCVFIANCYQKFFTL